MGVKLQPGKTTMLTYQKIAAKPFGCLTLWFFALISVVNSYKSTIREKTNSSLVKKSPILLAKLVSFLWLIIISFKSERNRETSMIIDLSLPFKQGMRGVDFETATTIQDQGWNSRTLHLYSHATTHLDAPRHFINQGKTVDQLNPQYRVLDLNWFCWCAVWLIYPYWRSHMVLFKHRSPNQPLGSRGNNRWGKEKLIRPLA